MANCIDRLNEWKNLGQPARDEEVEFALAFDPPRAENALRAALVTIVGGHEHQLRPAFDGVLKQKMAGRFWILTFPKLKTPGAESLAFETARCLRAELDAQSVRPVLYDALDASHAVARRAAPTNPATDSALSGICTSNDVGPIEKGWAPRALGCIDAWKVTSGEGIKIASIDTGWSTHDELEGVFIHEGELNLVEPGEPASDHFSTDVLIPTPGHATVVASVVASRGTVDVQANTGAPGIITGMAPQARILPIRALRSTADKNQTRIGAAIEHAIGQECDIIVMALGGPFLISTVEAALNAAAAAGIITVCAAGNCWGSVVYPAKLAAKGLVTAVAAVDHALKPWEKTSKGPEVTISAFGEDVWAARKESADAPNNAVKAAQGTTLATSLTAGAAALWMAANGGRAKLLAKAGQHTTVQKMFNEALRRTAYTPPNWPQGMGAGLLNAHALAQDRPSAAGTDALVASVSLPVYHVTPMRRMLGATIAEESGELATLEAYALDEDFAAEALWNLFMARATRRAAAAAPDLAPALHAAAAASVVADAHAIPRESKAFKAELAKRPHLAALLTG